MNTRSRFASHLGLEIAHAWPSEERAWIEALFTRIGPESSFYEDIGHVNMRVLDDAPLSLLGVHIASEGSEKAHIKVSSP